MTITGSGFDANATVWCMAPAGTTCAGSTTDPNGNLLCPVTVNSSAADTITVISTAVRRRAAGRSWSSIPTPSGTLPKSDPQQQLRSPQLRWLLGGDRADEHRPLPPRRRIGFDAFGNAYIYAIGGQATDGTCSATPR